MSYDKRDSSPEYNEEQRDDARLPGTGETTQKMGVGRYLATRFSTLKPPMDKVENPITVLRLLSSKQWLFFLCAFVAWTWDAFGEYQDQNPRVYDTTLTDPQYVLPELYLWQDIRNRTVVLIRSVQDFFTVSLTVTDLAEEFDRSKTDITWGITLVLMFRSVGAIAFGIAADRYGRKWPFVVNNILFIVLELGTGFCNTYQQFLAVRALFGIAMGGLYGNAAATALEDCPERARGIVSGMLQQGYAFGYLLATVFARALVNTTPHGWRPLFWFGACPPVLFIAFRMCLPETDAYIERQRVRAAGQNVGKTFVKEGKVALKRHWLLLVYLVLLMAGMNFM